MKKERKFYARYHIVRGHQSLWKGDAAQAGSQFRSVVITSDEFNSTQGTFQVYALEGIGKGIQDGKFVGTEDDPTLLMDEDFQGADAAGKRFHEILKGSVENGFKPVSLWDEMEFQANLKR
jgi:hypothetical protein